tara:strand:- start:721 stop:939 length:219 start_codon:yes stop_codon:yes gene_type:complete
LFATWFREFGVDIAVVEGKRETGAEAPSAVELVDYPEHLDREVTGAGVFEMCEEALFSVKTHFETVTGGAAD